MTRLWFRVQSKPKEIAECLSAAIPCALSRVDANGRNAFVGGSDEDLLQLIGFLIGAHFTCFTSTKKYKY